MSDPVSISGESHTHVSEYVEFDNTPDLYRYFHMMKMHARLIKAKHELDCEYNLDPANYKFISILKPEEITGEFNQSKRDSLVQSINQFIIDVMHMRTTDTEKLKLIELGNIMITTDDAEPVDELMSIVISYITEMLPHARSIANELISICEQLVATFRELITTYSSDIVSIGNSIIDQLVNTFKSRIYQHEPKINEYVSVVNLFTDVATVSINDPIQHILGGILRLDSFLICMTIRRILFSPSSKPKLYIKQSKFDPAMSKLELIDRLINTPVDIIDEREYNRLRELSQASVDEENNNESNNR